MVSAFVMVKTATGEVEAVTDRIDEMAAVTETHVVAGDFDVIVEVETAEMYEVMETVASAIHDIAGVEETKTYVSMG
ncbi:Lrp/AsnC family transcriptional regulator [Halobaculum sp. MBLA0147]|uniref:Lrp/AsnC family transcriptional regulator n=1 Tax=Halobaculum sp. MBLA0147 TaxID=3079934 RepID=UPI003523BBE9